ncbi:hypothetical protein SAZ11_00545 [Streptomyces sp. FXJ1.4098]|nr:hypothetical protein [Streptomyces sp. FXJ1.4098]
MAQQFGREIWTTSAVPSQTVPQGAQRPVLTLNPPAQAGASSAAVQWTSTKPVDPQNPTNTSRPVPAPPPLAASEAVPAPAGRAFTVRFDSGSTMVSEDDVADIEDLAREVASSALADWRAGRPLPSGVVTGFGEGPAVRAREMGQERAETVLAWFEDSLDEVLAGLQRGCRRPTGSPRRTSGSPPAAVARAWRPVTWTRRCCGRRRSN